MTRSLRVARIGKPHGIRGEVTAEIFTDSPSTRFAEGSLLEVWGATDAHHAFPVLTVASHRWNKHILLLRFVEVSDRDTAQTLRNFELYASAADRVDKDAWYAEDLIGLAVHKDRLDQKIGVVQDLIPGRAQDLLVITLSDGSEVLIPFVEEIVPEINEKRGVVLITPPPGLLELNQE